MLIMPLSLQLCHWTGPRDCCSYMRYWVPWSGVCRKNCFRPWQLLEWLFLPGQGPGLGCAWISQSRIGAGEAGHWGECWNMGWQCPVPCGMEPPPCVSQCRECWAGEALWGLLSPAWLFDVATAGCGVWARDWQTNEFTLHLLKVILRLPASRILIFVSFFVIFPMKITTALISMLMYSCLHLTSEYVMANYHYTGREIRALTEVLGVGTKGGQCCALAKAQKWWPSILKLVESGEGGLLAFFFSS